MFEKDSISTTLTVSVVDEHPEGECCVGCKVEGFIEGLKNSADVNDQKLSGYFSNALARFNEDQEREKRSAARGC